LRAIKTTLFEKPPAVKNNKLERQVPPNFLRRKRTANKEIDPQT
jgi:hypothetical protein